MVGFASLVNEDVDAVLAQVPSCPGATPSFTLLWRPRACRLSQEQWQESGLKRSGFCFA